MVNVQVIGLGCMGYKCSKQATGLLRALSSYRSYNLTCPQDHCIYVFALETLNSEVQIRVLGVSQVARSYQRYLKKKQKKRDETCRSHNLRWKS